VDDDDAGAYELVYAEAVRASSRQQDAFESLRTRAGVVLSGAAIASSLVGGRAVGSGRIGPAGWIAVTCFSGLALALLVILWPRPEWQGSPLPSRVIETDIEGPEPLPLKLIWRDLALHMQQVYLANDAHYERLARSFRLAAILLNLEVLAWIGDLVTKA
jgi:hypothetical protein